VAESGGSEEGVAEKDERGERESGDAGVADANREEGGWMLL
jgi:hypothetical protein